MKSFMLKLSKDAGNLIMRHYGKIQRIEEKDNESYFTNVDLASEKLIINAIRKKFPNHNIVSEESSNIDNKSEYTWYIDPIDGTHNYIRGLPFFGVSIGMSHKGNMKYGTINMPFFKEVYYAEKGKRATLNGKKICVSKERNLKKAFVLTDLALRYDIENKMDKITKLKKKVYDIRTLGCAVAGYTLVAKGIADAYYTTKTFPWDVAAGALIVEESRGKVTDLKGKSWNADMGNYISSNGKIHGQLADALK